MTNAPQPEVNPLRLDGNVLIGLLAFAAFIPPLLRCFRAGLAFSSWPSVSNSDVDIIAAQFMPMSAVRLRLIGMPALVRHIAHVVELSTEPEMIGSAARRVVTGVTDEQAIGNGAVLQFPCEAVRQDRVPVGHHEPAVSIHIPRALPLPAAVAPDEESLESKFWWPNDSVGALRIAKMEWVTVPSIPPVVTVAKPTSDRDLIAPIHRTGMRCKTFHTSTIPQRRAA